MKKTWLLDNGHGGLIGDEYVTKGKRSPKWEDGTQYFEGIGNRNIVNLLAEQLAIRKIDHLIVTPEQQDISLPDRVQRINNHYKTHHNCVVVSIHSNGYKKESAHGWEVFTSVGQTKSDLIATEFYKAAQAAFPEEKMRPNYTDGDPDKESQFYILKKTHCPAILTENFFHTNERECKKYLMCEEGIKMIVGMHLQAILNVEHNTKL